MEFLNPDVMNQSNMGIQGVQIWAQLLDGTTGKYSDKLLDFGGIEDLALNINEDKNELKTSRYGVQQTVKVLTTSLTENATFNTINNTDPLVLGIYEGNTALTGTAAGGSTAAPTIIIRRPGATWQARLFVAYPGAPGTDSTLLFIPRVQIGRGGQTPSGGTDAAKRGFEITFLADDQYKVPQTILASNDLAPHGVLGILEPSANPVEDLKVLGDALLPASTP